MTEKSDVRIIDWRGLKIEWSEQAGRGGTQEHFGINASIKRGTGAPGLCIALVGPMQFEGIGATPEEALEEVGRVIDTWARHEFWAIRHAGEKPGDISITEAIIMEQERKAQEAVDEED